MELGYETSVVSYGHPTPGAVAILPEVTGCGSLCGLARLAVGAVRLWRLCRTMQPDIVHAHWLTGPGWVAALSRARPLVVSAWGSDALRWTPASRQARLLAHVVARRASATTFDANAVADALAAEGFPRKRLVRTVVGADGERFCPRPPSPDLLARLGALADRPVVVSPRGLGPVYRPETVVEALAAVSRQRPVSLLLRVAPADEERLPALAALAEQLGFDGLVPYRDVSSDDLPHLLASADAVVSVPESDGTSIVLLEAILSGAPVVVSDLPANREWIPAETGWIVPVGDAHALAGAVGRILDDPHGARTASKAAAARARHAGDRETQLQTVRRLYEIALG